MAASHNDEPPPLEDMDALPFVTEVYERDLDFEKYNIPYLQYPYVSLYTGRGCRARARSASGRRRSAGTAIARAASGTWLEEMAEAARLFPQVKEFFFDDDTFTDDPPRAEAIAEGSARSASRGRRNAKANVPHETLKVLKDNGLRLFVVGYESGNEQILNNIQKGVRLERRAGSRGTAKALGILIHGTFILGLPGETRETIARDHPLRARDRSRHDPGLARRAVSGHRAVRGGAAERLARGRRRPRGRSGRSAERPGLSPSPADRDLPIARASSTAASTSGRAR